MAIDEVTSRSLINSLSYFIRGRGGSVLHLSEANVDQQQRMIRRDGIKQITSQQNVFS